MMDVMQAVVDRFLAALRTCNPKLGERKREKYAPVLTLVTAVLAFVADHFDVVVGQQDLRLVSTALLVVSVYLIRHYEQPAED